jgi:hypothetical protein
VADDTGGPAPNPTLRLLGLTSGLGCSIAFLLLALIGGGIWLDRRLGTDPAWTLVGVTVGVLAVSIELVAIVRISRSRANQQPWPKSSRPPEPDEDQDEDDWGVGRSETR